MKSVEGCAVDSGEVGNWEGVVCLVVLHRSAIAIDWTADCAMNWRDEYEKKDEDEDEDLHYERDESEESCNGDEG